ncbi:hypothetical protein XENTR_v10019335 [Xenopus tropicalis]|nr:hypothetical protein XENTR_v10019335 [Xenopus tropicalis]
MAAPHNAAEQRVQTLKGRPVPSLSVPLPPPPPSHPSPPPFSPQPFHVGFHFLQAAQQQLGNIQPATWQLQDPTALPLTLHHTLAHCDLQKGKQSWNRNIPLFLKIPLP